MSNDAAYDKYNKLSIVASIIFLIAMLMIIGIHYLEKKQKLDETEYDILTNIISDYTVKLNITDEIYEMFIDYSGDKITNENTCAA